jgi:hypothetical protein
MEQNPEEEYIEKILQYHRSFEWANERQYVRYTKFEEFKKNSPDSYEIVKDFIKNYIKETSPQTYGQIIRIINNFRFYNEDKYKIDWQRVDNIVKEKFKNFKEKNIEKAFQIFKKFTEIYEKNDFSFPVFDKLLNDYMIPIAKKFGSVKEMFNCFDKIAIDTFSGIDTKLKDFFLILEDALKEFVKYLSLHEDFINQEVSNKNSVIFSKYYLPKLKNIDRKTYDKIIKPQDKYTKNIHEIVWRIIIRNI